MANTALQKIGLRLAFSVWIMKTVEVMDFRAHSAPTHHVHLHLYRCKLSFRVLLLDHSTFGNVAMVDKVHH